MIEETLRTHIARSGENLNAIAKAAGIDYSTLYRFVNEKRKIQVNIVQKLCRYFGLELTYSDAKVSSVVQQVAKRVLATSPSDFKYRNGRLNREAIRQYLEAEETLPITGLDRNDQEVAAYYDRLSFEHKKSVLENAISRLALGTRLNEATQRRLAEVDQSIQELKDAWENMNDSARTILRQYVSSAADLQKNEYKFSTSHLFRMRVDVSHFYGDEDGDECDANKVTLRPVLMLHAIDAWERGEEFTPKGTMGLLF